MAKGKKKKNFTLVILLVIMAALIVGYVVYGSMEKKKKAEKADEKKTEENVNVVTMDENSLSKIEYQNQDVKADVTLVKSEDGTWKVQGQESAPVDATSVSDMTKLLSSLKANKVIMKNCKDLSQFGLDQPAVTITATATDGTKNTILVGAKSLVGTESYYITVNDDATVYLVAPTIYTYFNKRDTELFSVAKAPTITDTNITELKIEDKKKGNFEITYQKDNPYDIGGSGIYPYTIMQGYDTPVLADADKIKTFFDNYCKLEYQGCVEYDCKDLSKYGLDDPQTTLTIGYFEESDPKKDNSSPSTSAAVSSSAGNTAGKKERTDYTYQLAIGNLDKDGSVYYVRDLSANTVYKMQSALVDTMLNYKKFDAVGKYVQLINVKSVSSIDMITKDQTITLSDKTTSKKNDQGKEEEDTQFWLNGKSYKTDLARDLYQLMIGPQYDQEIPADKKPEWKDPVVSFVFHRNTSDYQDVKVEYYPYNDSFYAVKKGDEQYFVVDKRLVDDMISNALDAVKVAGANK